MRRAAISRRASTVGLSFASLLSSCGSTPLASWRARLAAIITSSKRLSTTSRQSSTVMRAMSVLRPAGRCGGFKEPGIVAMHGPDRKHRPFKSTTWGRIPPLRAAFAPPRAPGPGLRVDQQRGDQLRMARHLRVLAQPAGGEDAAHLGHRDLEHLVDDHVVELAVVAHLLARGRQPPGDHLVAVLPALAHALLQRCPRGRQDEHADRVGDPRPHLARALPVDLQQHVAAGRQQRLHRLPRGALPVAVHQRVLEEVAGGDHRLELGGGDEVVVLGVALARARLARGERDRQADPRVARKHRVDDAGLPGARRRGDDVEGSAHEVRNAWRETRNKWRRPLARACLPLLVPRSCPLASRYSMFWICSRTWSISTFSSTAALLVRASTDLLPRVLASRLNSCSRKSRRRPTGSLPPLRIRRSSDRWLSSRSSSSS